MTHRVSFHPLARRDLFDLYNFIETQSGATRAGGYIERIERACRALREFPLRSTARDDIAPGVRTIALERRVLIPLRVTLGEVTILRVLYAGRDFIAADLPN